MRRSKSSGATIAVAVSRAPAGTRPLFADDFQNGDAGGVAGRDDAGDQGSEASCRECRCQLSGRHCDGGDAGLVAGEGGGRPQ